MKSVLLIEDDPFLIDIYTTKLKEVGFSVEVASDGESGWNKLLEKKFDLLILDIVLPYVDGWEILRRIKEKQIENLKIVVLSNIGEKVDIEKGIRMGVEKYLIKAHYTPSEVVKEIEKILK